MFNLVSEVHHSLKPVGYNYTYHVSDLSSYIEKGHFLNKTYLPYNDNDVISSQSTEGIQKLISQEPTSFNGGKDFLRKYLIKTKKFSNMN